jgi:hypothetical protein
MCLSMKNTQVARLFAYVTGIANQILLQERVLGRRE